MPTKNLPPLGQKVKFCRIKAADGNGPAELIKGEGTMVGHIIGITRRVQAMVKDGDISSNKAWTLEPHCINPTDEEAQAYLDHHLKIEKVVADHNAEQEGAILATNAHIDRMNADMFGPAMDV